MGNTAVPRTIKSLALDYVHRCGGRASYEALTEEVRRHFPQSKWQKTHWAWYRHQILHGRFRGMFSAEELAALADGHGRPDAAVPPPQLVAAAPSEPLARGPAAKNPAIKRLGDALLSHVRWAIGLAAGDDFDKRFKLNRWVFSRLLQDEIRIKRPIKQKLWDAGIRRCQACGEPFASLKGVEIHRKDGTLAYSEANCELLCRECHQEPE